MTFTAVHNYVCELLQFLQFFNEALFLAFNGKYAVYSSDTGWVDGILLKWWGERAG